MVKDLEIKSKYFPIEVDLKMTPEEKIPFMIDWYQEAENLWKGVSINFEALINLIKENGPELRDGTVELCK